MRRHLCWALLLEGGAAINFPYESIQLTVADVSNFSSVAFGSASAVVSSNSTCRAFPGTDDWPPDADWARLNTTVDGQLLHPIPLGAVCYPGTSGMGVYNMTQCLSLLYGAFDSRVFIDDPLTVLTQWPQGETCNATPFASGNCTRGGFPEYVVNVSTVKHVQAAVNFARNKNIRLVIKNTGHDFVGRSAGAGSLSVWTHHLKSFEFLPSYTSTSGYIGMAARVGVGLEAWELYKYMDRYNMTLVVPGGQTVGAFGGWMAGGGHSSLGSMFGMGSDQVLALNVVTADGNFITVDSETNADLFYALRGGGPGTYGIVTSAIVRAFPAVHVSEASISFQVGSFPTFGFGNLTGNVSFPGNYSIPFNLTNPLNLTSPFNGTFENRTWKPPRPITAPSVDAFWKAVSAYFRFGKELCDGGGTGYSYVSQISPGTNGSDGSYSFSTTLELPGMAPSNARSFLQPLYTSLNQLGINVSNTLPRTSLSWGPGPQQGAGASPGDVRFATRLFPRENWESDQRFDAMMDTLRSVIQAGYSFHGVQVAPADNLPAVLSPGNSSVNPAFRKALMHGDIFDYSGFGGDYDVSSLNYTSAVTASRARFESMLDRIRAVTPGSGAYINEADPDEPDWQRSFWGSKYPRLLQIKKARDPWGVFWAPKTVGSEGWSVQTEPRFAGSQNGGLCRVSL